MENEKFTFFYRSAHPFSQWYACFFQVKGITYSCAEQYMMHQKALLFGDTVMAEKILKASQPRHQKAFGRKVQDFDAQIWQENAKRIVYEANHAKFTQNKAILQTLMDTDGTTLVEASPTDTIWGIGLDENDARAYSRSTWQGTNWLGEVLTQLREDLKTV
jgi:ribA/ribD-fused uncharacterized protein